MATFVLNTEEVLSVIGLPIRGRAKGGSELICDCPVCGHKKKLSASKINGAAQCFACGWHGSLTGLYARVNNLPYSTKEDKKDAFKKLVGDNGSNYLSIPEVEEKKSVETAPAEVLHRAYSIFLKMLTLTKRDRAELRKRGLTDEEIDKLYYKSTPKYGTDHHIYADKLIEKGIDPKGIPGFFMDKEHRYTLVYTKQGILIPVRNAYGQIVGLRLRLRNPEVDEEGKPKSKYRWISTDGRYKGSSSKTPYHFACDRVEIFGTWMPDCKPTKGETSFLITEGEIKADIIHAVSKANVLSIPGINVLSGLKDALNILKRRGVTVIYDAYDMDFVLNPNVAEASKKMRQIIEDAGFKYIRLNWNQDYKGFDDYLVWRFRNNGRA